MTATSTAELAIVLCAMVFFGWLVYQAPATLSQPILSIVAMASTVAMFAVWMWRRFR